MYSRVTLGGSHRQHPSNSSFAGYVSPDDIIDLTIVLRSCEQVDLEAVREFAVEYGLSVIDVFTAARCVTLSGPASAITSAFGAQVELRSIEGVCYRMRQGHLYVPEHLSDRVIAVLGLDQRPVARTSHQVRKHVVSLPSYTPVEIAKLYRFPGNGGANQSIALIELGGGYRDSDLQSYWSMLGLKNVSVTAVGVSGASNSPTGDPDGADGEVALDIEVVGAIAPEANIYVYFAPNTDAGFLAAINAAIHDEARKPSVISISWGAAESEWTPQAMNAFNAAFHDAALLGISVCVAAGDNGSSDGESDGHNHVDFPASSPWVLACGGTRLVGADGQIHSETVWNNGTAGGATGGGVSAHFSKPLYQSHIKVPKPSGTANSTGRGVPDVAGVADPETGYIVLVDGEQSVVGGTSAVAPLWAGLIALCNEQLGRKVGFLQPELYNAVMQNKGLHDITSGNNGTYHASTGWDPCTGLGTPNGTAILNAFKQAKK